MSTLIYYLRFSSSKQQDGTSIERQHDLCDSYSRIHNLGPVDHVYKDEGKSGYTGANLSKGELGDLLEDLQNGTFRPPVTVLCESVDRISRGEIQVASGLVQELQQYCTLITVMDQQVYQQGKYDLVGMVTLLVKSSLAREESEKKAKRSRDTHNFNRAAGKYLNDKIKRYLQMSPDRLKSESTVIPEEAEFIRELFKLKRMGYGVHRLLKAQHQLRGDLPEYGKTSLMALFKDRELVDRGIISGTDFTMVQVDRPKVTGGRRNPTNLLRGVLHCGYCGAKLIYKAPSNGSLSGTLLCNTRNIKGSSVCDFPYINYQRFEGLMLDSLGLLARELFTHKIVDIAALEARQEELEASLTEIGQNILNVSRSMARFPDLLEQSLVPFEKERQDATDELAKVKEEYAEAVSNSEDIQLVAPTTDEERTAFNLRLTKAVSKLTVELSKDGKRYRVKGDKSDVGVIIDRDLTEWRLYDQIANKESDTPEPALEFGEEFE